MDLFLNIGGRLVLFRRVRILFPQRNCTVIDIENSVQRVRHKNERIVSRRHNPLLVIFQVLNRPFQVAAWERRISSRCTRTLAVYIDFQPGQRCVHSPGRSESPV